MVRFSVLVADDEKMPREILRDHLPWEELGVERVEEAEDGAQALELARVHRPDTASANRRRSLGGGRSPP